jgi:hypothetical protein
MQRLRANLNKQNQKRIPQVSVSIAELEETRSVSPSSDIAGVPSTGNEFDPYACKPRPPSPPSPPTRYQPTLPAPYEPVPYEPVPYQPYSQEADLLQSQSQSQTRPCPVTPIPQYMSSRMTSTSTRTMNPVAEEEPDNVSTTTNHPVVNQYQHPTNNNHSRNQQSDAEKASYKRISNMLNDMYNNDECENSTALDIVSIYLKGQKILYIEAKTLCEKRLNALMLPAIFISAISTLLSVQLKTYEYGGMIVALLSACNSFILSLISYLKLDAKAEAHRTASYKFDKLQSLCEFNSGKILFFENDADLVEEVLTEIETNVKEIKETNQFILPERIRYNFPILYSTNVFSLVKKLQHQEMILSNKLKTIVDKLMIKYKQLEHTNTMWSTNAIDKVEYEEQSELYTTEIQELEKQQNVAIEAIINWPQLLRSVVFQVLESL